MKLYRVRLAGQVIFHVWASSSKNAVSACCAPLLTEEERLRAIAEEVTR